MTEYEPYDYENDEAGKALKDTPLYMNQELDRIKKVTRHLNKTQPGKYEVREVRIVTR